jgi:hypothetical protein
MNKNFDDTVLASLPRLPALEEGSLALFDAIRRRALADVDTAIKGGAPIEAVQPFRQQDNEIVGGYTALHEACSVPPGYSVCLEIVATLLAAGADPNRFAEEADGGSALMRLATCLPRNGAQVAETLINGGATPTIELIERALTAEKLWTEPCTSLFALPLVRVFWKHMASEEKQLLDGSMVSSIVSFDQQHAVDSESVKRAKWVIEQSVEPKMSPDSSPAAARSGGMKFH